ncbi:MAG: helical backbone metal receptor [Flavobacteriales bacterium]|nr:helical backbone metal receptor [Flavobacteriales bacterium]
MAETQTHIDQLGRRLELVSSPQRIVSLVPSQTELLFDLGLVERVVGITKFCVHPDHWFYSKTRVGGTKKLDFEAIHNLKPDLIIANKEENNKEEIESLEKDFPVWVSDVNNLDSALEMIRLIAEVTKTDSSKLTQEIQSGFSQLRPIQPQKKVLYLIWKNPYMVAGSDTFVHDMMLRCGFENAVTDKRYPELNEEEIVQLNPELILLSSEPFPFAEKHIQQLQNLLPKATIKLVDGEIFSWYGSRLKLAVPYFGDLVKSIAK